MTTPPSALSVTSHRATSPSGTLLAWVIRPGALSGLPPLVALHGISRNAAEMTELFLPEAEQSGRAIIVPHFPEDRWPRFQRPGLSARPDRALLALLSHLGATDPALVGPVDLFGHSGGAQLAHRFAMLYPHKLRRLNLSAAGWYCLPDASLAYPYGIGADAAPESLSWARRHGEALPHYLRLAVRVFVGTEDTERDRSLRQTPMLDRSQGRTRVERAETFVSSFRAAARQRGILPDIGLTRLAGVTHDFAQAVARGNLARLVAADIPQRLSAAS